MTMSASGHRLGDTKTLATITLEPAEVSIACNLSAEGAIG